MGDIASLVERFAGSGQRVFEHAMRGAREGGRNYITSAHLVVALAAEESRRFAVLMRALRVDANRVQQLIAERLEDGPQHPGRGLRLAPEMVSVLKAAGRVAHAHGQSRIGSADLMIALAEDEGGVFVEVLKSLEADVGAAGEDARALYGCLLVLSRSLSRGELFRTPRA